MNVQAHAFTIVLRTPPVVRRAIAWGSYQLVSLGYATTLRLDDRSARAERDVADSAFMNYGYVADDDEPLELPPALEVARTQIAMYRHVLRGVDVRGRDVVEVGCGRGGGAAWVADVLEPATMVGVDLAPGAIAFCRSHHVRGNLRFETGKAESLPLGDVSADVIVNVESSHYYDMDAFLAEVVRVLRPGGHLCWADTRAHDQLPALDRSFDASTLATVQRRDISPEVLKALVATSARRNEVIEGSFPCGTHYLARTMLGVPGTPLFAAYERGFLRYESALLRKPEVTT
ncbi:MAG: hypothetical protein QOH83_1603 [Solirubrobacteraceae bacterium]|jgi:SAM-dependent methyltransferase|nr:hypothetical protein [Solirubrobacteraceae bacterium]